MGDSRRAGSPRARSEIDTVTTFFTPPVRDARRAPASVSRCPPAPSTIAETACTQAGRSKLGSGSVWLGSCVHKTPQLGSSPRAIVTSPMTVTASWSSSAIRGCSNASSAGRGQGWRGPRPADRLASTPFMDPWPWFSSEMKPVDERRVPRGACHSAPPKW